MDPTPQEDQQQEPALPRVSARARIIGSVIAVLVVAGLGWLAWDLTHSSGGASGAASGASGARAGGGGGGGFGGGGGGRGGPPTTVGVAAAERADLPVTIDALGTVVPLATVKVRPQVSGVLQQVNFKEGQMVKKGDLLAQIDPRQFEMALQQATGARMKDEAQLQAAKVTLERFRTLLKQDSIARQEVDTQEALVKQLEATLVVDRANEGTARLNLGYTRIVAPVAGRVGLRVVDVGNVVSSSDANGVALITQLSPIDVEFAIPQDQAAWMQQNMGAFMEAKAFDRTRQAVLDTGTFASLDNQVDVQTGTVRAKARFNNARGVLFPSQFVNVQVNVRTIKDAVVVPVAAVRHGANNNDFVFVLNQDRTVSMRTVKTGQQTVDKVQVTSGLQLGERVITEGADRLREGSRVVLPGDAPGAGGGGGGRRRQGASAPAGAGSAPALPEGSPAQAPQQQQGQPRMARRGAASGDTGAAAAPPAATATAGAGPSDKPTPEQRQRMLDSAQGDAEQLERRKRFLDALDRGDPQAIERWRAMQQRRREGGAAQ
ncbi:efflux RND transporter periplasmic adaptor subunit [Ramlibacter sp. PS4R-6]|uniref:efflux RND transporter periplasmic adaptor subunit n=1 Tax=Ramlibacter sp. PS4R-6 TaxID=3133438 RepID=UPI0030A3A765